ncbi:hypothetical protein [Paracraurococcus ruber]|uniref:DUF4124 domain-containing protein n=1 Tax=Paracraurococcus ruber TaxID=77675 RepID=A0ABS1CSI9_9PROT|nr:hypothetical protein [Paracraurococcus ruber]MBK1656809.1 hypothetical protein [Paracraurococcus ruber]TDG33924.1 hypothetical protein E2C05_01395 [Paracraurococcus ruber]
MTRLLPFAALALACSLLPARAETLRCQSVNGNVTCAGSGAASCQRVDGRTVCTSGQGGIVQEFGGRPDAEAARRLAERRLRIERQGPAGALTLEREGGRLRLRTDRLDLDVDD